MRLARAALSLHCSFIRAHHLDEPAVIDGLRSFWISQYLPNEFLLLLGKRSRFLYAFSAYTLRRSGRMSEAQKRKRDELERIFRAAGNATESGFSAIVEELTRMGMNRAETPQIVLHTDEHQGYLRALRKHGGWSVLREANRERHERTSSRAARTAHNPLAAANSFDRSVRNDLAEHVRETIRFARSVGNSQDRFAVYQHWHNYRKPASVDESRHERRKHAELIGSEEIELGKMLDGFFTKRVFYTRNPPWGVYRDVWLKVQRTPLLGRADYLPAYMVA